ncbi:MAG: hypothetical protein R3B45_07815 [Bdellovibrionota bacterium]
MKHFKLIFSIILASLILTGCDGKTAADPETASLSDLNAPSDLYTVTQSGAIKLGWAAGNVEEDFKGYLVLGTTKKLEDIKSGLTYPSTDAQDAISALGLPRCKGNSAFFEAFGFPAATNDCEGVNTEDTTGEDSTDNSDTENDDSAAKEETKKEDLTGVLLPCEERSAEVTMVSLDVKPPVTSMQECTVKQVYDPSTKGLIDIVDGTPMTFIVFSVLGSDYDTLSWSSNAVEDASSTTIIDNEEFVLKTDEYQALTFTVAETGITAAFAPSAADCGSDPHCKLSSANNETPSSPTIYIARDAGSGTHLQRVFVSVPQNSDIEIQTKYDPGHASDGSIEDRVARDDPEADYESSGLTINLDGPQVFDFRIKTGTNTYNYGKLVLNLLAMLM